MGEPRDPMEALIEAAEDERELVVGDILADRQRAARKAAEDHVKTDPSRG